MELFVWLYITSSFMFNRFKFFTILFWYQMFVINAVMHTFLELRYLFGVVSWYAARVMHYYTVYDSDSPAIRVRARMSTITVHSSAEILSSQFLTDTWYWYRSYYLLQSPFILLTTTTGCCDSWGCEILHTHRSSNCIQHEFRFFNPIFLSLTACDA